MEVLIAPTLPFDELNNARASGARFEDEPGYYEPGGVWLYGNTRLLHANLACVANVAGKRHFDREDLNQIEQEAERLVLLGAVLVTGIHNEGYMRAALVPLRWGSPRVIVFSGGFCSHLGSDLRSEPFSAAQLWRYCWDAKTDLAVSLCAPNQEPKNTFCNPTIDQLIARLVHCAHQVAPSVADPLGLVPT